MESCVGKAIVSGVMGFALGGAFGLFMSSVRSKASRRRLYDHSLLRLLSLESTPFLQS